MGGEKREKQQPNLAQLGLLPIGSAMDKNSSMASSSPLPLGFQLGKKTKCAKPSFRQWKNPFKQAAAS
jgi:hypothetical protein